MIPEIGSPYREEPVRDITTGWGLLLQTCDNRINDLQGSVGDLEMRLEVARSVEAVYAKHGRSSLSQMGCSDSAKDVAAKLKTQRSLLVGWQEAKRLVEVAAGNGDEAAVAVEVCLGESPLKDARESFEIRGSLDKVQADSRRKGLGKWADDAAKLLKEP